MKRIKLLLLLLILTVGFLQESFAQTNDKIEAARVALITKRLDLSPEQAEKFWPLYNEFNNERNSLKQEYLQARNQYRQKELTEAESEKLLQLGYKLKDRELQLEKRFTERAGRVISNRQIIALRKAEDDFKRMLLENLKKRREQQERIQNRKERRFRDN